MVHHQGQEKEQNERVVQRQGRPATALGVRVGPWEPPPPGMGQSLLTREMSYGTVTDIREARQKGKVVCVLGRAKTLKRFSESLCTQFGWQV